jgi:hypothetical protein
MVFVSLWTISFFFAHSFACGSNFSAFWTSFETLHTQCTETFKLEYRFTVTDLLSDVFILLILIPLVCVVIVVYARSRRRFMLMENRSGSYTSPPLASSPSSSSSSSNQGTSPLISPAPSTNASPAP